MNMARINSIPSVILGFLLAFMVLLLTAQPVDAQGSWSVRPTTPAPHDKQNPSAGDVGNYDQFGLQCDNSCTAWQMVKLDFVIC
ncbi:hypothetical protein BDK51DRAFT_42214 [Blyttiomyces helicus]|uniref:Uncharacterized protein n=1 Tax=Blyttiomyces helicus TaxID=388810 RepID=A0A4P9W8E9_9FUNG|nr:hypothetical protein BDK51DRAFT_42214 [Blyttiomyces helicus]|eukprot:RKO88372.1 hypothetical protein BDK51DRAFT_42214 [Blyttiomyces helicus]